MFVFVRVCVCARVYFYIIVFGLTVMNRTVSVGQQPNNCGGMKFPAVPPVYRQK